MFFRRKRERRSKLSVTWHMIYLSCVLLEGWRLWEFLAVRFCAMPIAQKWILLRIVDSGKLLMYKTFGLRLF